MPRKNIEERLAYERQWRHANRERVAKYNREYRRTHPRKDYDAHRLKRTGVTPEMFAIALESQKGLCALCKLPFGDQPPHADHDHDTKKFRGLLHRNCNVGLGYFHEDIQLLEAAIEFLKQHKILGGAN